MGAYNEVRARLTCPNCKATVDVDVQFKYGAVAHHKYHIGSAIVWGANDAGTPGHAVVVADGEAVRCPNCAWDDDWPVYVAFERDIICGVIPADGQHDFASAHEAFIVLRDR